jgi:hypothetical protein
MSFPWKPIFTLGLSLLWDEIGSKQAQKVVKHVCDALEGKHGGETQQKIQDALAKGLVKAGERATTAVHDRLDEQAKAARDRVRR